MEKTARKIAVVIWKILVEVVQQTDSSENPHCCPQ
jgi:hypothetical protein